jgi:hypothetical protein
MTGHWTVTEGTQLFSKLVGQVWYEIPLPDHSVSSTREHSTYINLIPQMQRASKMFQWQDQVRPQFTRPSAAHASAHIGK